MAIVYVIARSSLMTCEITAAGEGAGGAATGTLAAGSEGAGGAATGTVVARGGGTSKRDLELAIVVVPGRFGTAGDRPRAADATGAGASGALAAGADDAASLACAAEPDERAEVLITASSGGASDDCPLLGQPVSSEEDESD